jgi:hypothetical protein
MSQDTLRRSFLAMSWAHKGPAPSGADADCRGESSIEFIADRLIGKEHRLPVHVVVQVNQEVEL